MCAGCDEKVLITKPGGVWFQCIDGVLTTWHFGCRLAAYDAEHAR